MSRAKYHKLEKIVRGFSNHRRIEILYFLDKHPRTSIGGVAKGLGILVKTASSHVNYLERAGLVWKHSDGYNVRCEITDWGKKALNFLKSVKAGN